MAHVGGEDGRCMHKRNCRRRMSVMADLVTLKRYTGWCVTSEGSVCMQSAHGPVMATQWEGGGGGGSQTAHRR